MKACLKCGEEVSTLVDRLCLPCWKLPVVCERCGQRWLSFVGPLCTPCYFAENESCRDGTAANPDNWRRPMITVKKCTISGCPFDVLPGTDYCPAHLAEDGIEINKPEAFCKVLRCSNIRAAGSHLCEHHLKLQQRVSGLGYTPVGIKNDQDKYKDRWDLLPFDAIEQIVKVYTYGAAKYQPRNWEKGLAFTRLRAALMRHLVAFFEHNEDNDPEWNLSHLAHAGCCLTMLLALHIRQTEGCDDRPIERVLPRKEINDLFDLATELRPAKYPNSAEGWTESCDQSTTVWSHDNPTAKTLASLLASNPAESLILGHPFPLTQPNPQMHQMATEEQSHIQEEEPSSDSVPSHQMETGNEPKLRNK
jgi:hypothetical protein